MSEGPSEFGTMPRSYLGDANYFHRVIPVLGVLMLLGGLAKSALTFSSGGLLLEATLDLILIGSLGGVLLFVRIWLPTTDIQREFYPRIAVWVLGGVGVMGIVLGLRVLHPGVAVDFTFGTQAVLLSIGSLAGLVIGVNEAQALTYARELERQNEKLKRTEGRLEEAVTQLEASNERLEQFAYAASHDLKEPLRMVTSYLELVADRYGDELDEDGAEFIAFAVDGADRMRDMVDGLLEYSRVETQGTTFGPVDLDTVLDDVLADLQVRIDETDGEITRDPLPTVDGDGAQLRQVFQNLLTNSIRYSGDEPPRIHVSADREDDEWTVSVHDDGVGIEADDTHRIFDIFERLHAVDEQSGSGIGLALCKRIVDRHGVRPNSGKQGSTDEESESVGGEIWVESVPGDGSTFYFTLSAA